MIKVDEDRLIQIDIQLITWFAEMGHHVYEGGLDFESWVNQWQDYGPEVIFGWTEPFEDEAAPTGWAYAVNPYLILQSIGGLGDETFQAYLDAVEWRLNRYFGHVPNRHLWDTIDSELFELAEGSLDLLLEVQRAYRAHLKLHQEGEE